MGYLAGDNILLKSGQRALVQESNGHAVKAPWRTSPLHKMQRDD